MPLHPFGIMYTEPPSQTGARKNTVEAYTVTGLESMQVTGCVFKNLCSPQTEPHSEKSFNQLGRTLWGTQGSWMIFGSQTATETCGTIIRWSEGSS